MVLPLNCIYKLKGTRDYLVQWFSHFFFLIAQKPFQLICKPTNKTKKRCCSDVALRLSQFSLFKFYFRYDWQMYFFLLFSLMYFRNWSVLFCSTVGHSLSPTHSLSFHLKESAFVCSHSFIISVKIRLDLLRNLLLRIQLLVMVGNRRPEADQQSAAELPHCQGVPWKLLTRSTASTSAPTARWSSWAATTTPSCSMTDCQEGKPKRTLYSKKYGMDLIRYTHAANTVVYSSNKRDDIVIICPCMTTNISGAFLDIAKGWWPCSCHLWMTLSFLGLLIRPFSSGISALLTARVSCIYRASQFVLLIQKD